MTREDLMRPFCLPTLALPALGLLLLTSACASASMPAGPTPVAVSAGPAPAPVAGYDWFYTPDGTAARLAYGLEASDDLRLGLDCDAGSGTVLLTAYGPEGVREIRLESGGDTARFAAAGEPSQLHDGDLLTARATTAHPVLNRFRRLGWIARWVGTTREVYVPHPGSKAGVERFFALCG